jgi:hypothetical protein
VNITIYSCIIFFPKTMKNYDFGDGEACDYLIRIITKASCFNDRHEKEI